MQTNPKAAAARASSHLQAVPLPVPAGGFVPPQLQTHDGADQVHHHGGEQEDDGGRLARLDPAERRVDAGVEDGVGAEAPPGRVPDVDDACREPQTPVRTPENRSRS